MVVGVADAAVVQPSAVGQMRVARLSTPRLLVVGMVLVCLPVAFLAAAVHAGVTSSDRTIDTVGQDATRGITVAQDIKLRLAELDQLAAGDLLVSAPLGEGGFPADYAAKRREVHEGLALAAAEVPGEAYQRLLVNVDYALGHYHALLRDTFAAAEAGNTAGAAELYRQAHEVMAGTLLPQADQLDKSSTYVLNDTYQRHTDDASSARLLIAVAAVVLVVFLVVVQVVLARRFRRTLNPALVVATLLAVIGGIYVVDDLGRASNHLAAAREVSFDSVHALARAQAVTVAARQAEAQMLLDPANSAAADEEFNRQVARLFRVRTGDAAEVALQGSIPEDVGAGGYVVTALGSRRDRAVEPVLTAFGEYVAGHESLQRHVLSGDAAEPFGPYQAGVAYNDLLDELQAAQVIDQQAFDARVSRARDAVRPVDRVNLVLAGAVLILALAALARRLREYRS